MKIRDISLWESFYWAAKEESFTRAAHRLKVGTPLLSKRISKLEEELGTRLFQRTTRKVKATVEGRALLPLIETTLQDFNSLEERFSAKDELSGTLRVSCVTAFAHRVLAPLIMEFGKKHPGVQFHVDPNDEILDMIDYQFDVAIRVEDPHGSDYIFKKCFDNDLVFVASPKYLKSLPFEIKRPSDLKKVSFMSLEVYGECKFIKCENFVRDYLDHAKVTSPSGMMVTEFARLGAGVALRSLWDVQTYLDSGELVQVLQNHPVEPFGTMYTVIPTRRLLAPRVRAFIDFLGEKLAVTGKV